MASFEKVLQALNPEFDSREVHKTISIQHCFVDTPLRFSEGDCLKISRQSRLLKFNAKTATDAGSGRLPYSFRESMKISLI